MSQLSTSPFPKGGTSGPGKLLAPFADKQTGKETLVEQLESLKSHQSAQTANSELCIVRRCLRKRLSPRPSKPLKCSNRN